MLEILGSKVKLLKSQCEFIQKSKQDYFSKLIYACLVFAE